MKYLVDPLLITDALKGESRAGRSAMALFNAHRADELFLAPTSYLALGPAFMGVRSTLDRFLDGLGIRVARNAPAKVMDTAYSVWSRYQADNPGAAGDRDAFDRLYVGACALVYDGILTRQVELYRRYFESLNVVSSAGEVRA